MDEPFDEDHQAERTEGTMEARPSPNFLLFLCKATYFSLFLSLSCIIPFLPIYYDNLGFSASKVGILLSIRPFTGILFAPFWGAVADAYKSHKV